ncbi:MAG: hypothetical protein QXT28_10870 [Thermofilaceae archaeon]
MIFLIFRALMYSSVNYFLLEGGAGNPCEGVIFTAVLERGLGR